MTNPALRPAPPAPHAAPIRVLIADDHPVIVWGLRQMIEADPQRMRVVATAASAAQLLELLERVPADVLLLDLDLRDANGLELLPRLVGQGLRVVVLTGDTNPAHHRDAVLRGARGVVLKGHPSEDVLGAIARVHAGEVWLEGALMALLLGGLPGASPVHALPRDEHQRRIGTLTPKERQVIATLVRHRGAKGFVVAEALDISEHTLRNHLTVIYSKLDVKGKLDLYVYATEHGLQNAPVDPATRPYAAGEAPQLAHR